MTRLAPLLAPALALALQGCCCCGLPDGLIPDDVADRAAGYAAEKALETATGSQIDAEQGSFKVKTDEGSFSISEGQAGLDPRMPLAPHPDCAVTGGMAMEADSKLSLTFAHEGCDVELDAMVAHFDKQLEQLDAEVKRTEVSSQTQEGLMLMAKGDGSRFEQISVVIGRDDQATTSAAVTAIVPSRKQAE